MTNDIVIKAHHRAETFLKIGHRVQRLARLTSDERDRRLDFIAKRLRKSVGARTPNGRRARARFDLRWRELAYLIRPASA
jgi:hypothetical protein